MIIGFEEQTLLIYISSYVFYSIWSKVKINRFIFSTGQLGYQAKSVDMAERFEKKNFVHSISWNIILHER